MSLKFFDFFNERSALFVMSRFGHRLGDIISNAGQYVFKPMVEVLGSSELIEIAAKLDELNGVEKEKEPDV